MARAGSRPERGQSRQRRDRPTRGRPPDRAPARREPHPHLGELLYGRNAALEALRAGRRRVEYLAVAAGAQRTGTLAQIIELAQARGIPVREVDRLQLDEAVPGHQGLALHVGPYPYADLDALIERVGPRALFLLLDCIEDPQNLGTLLRTADAVEIAGVVIPEHRAAAVTPAVSSASAGAVEHLSVARVPNLVRAMEQLREAGTWIIGLEDVPEAQAYDEVDWHGPLAVVVGSEGRGMRRLVRERCDLLVRLPIAGHTGSLNAAVAGSIALYHAWRIREREPKLGERR